MELRPALSRSRTETGKAMDTCHFKMTALNFLIGKLENKIAVTLWPEAQVLAVEI